MKGKVCLSSCREYGAALMMMVVEMVMLGGLGLFLARNQLDQEQHKKFTALVPFLKTRHL